MDWRDQGLLLRVRGYGESSAIIEVFTENHGRHLGIVRGGLSAKKAATLQPGSQLDLEWRARLEEHLGSYRVEPLKARAAMMMQDRAALACLNAVCGLLAFALAEREAHPRLYAATQNLLDLLGDGAEWQRAYLAWELLLLSELGFRLELDQCAVTGAGTGLAYVSPKSGRAVSRSGAAEWADRLLPYPDPDNIVSALATTGYFLTNWLAPALGAKSLPSARARLIGLLEKTETKRHPDAPI